MMRNLMTSLLLCSSSMILVSPLPAQETQKACILPVATCLNRELFRAYSQDFLPVYEALFHAMERGNVEQIQQTSKNLKKYLQSIKSQEIQEMIQPTLTYLDIMTSLQQYKKQREIFSFMISPLLNFLPQSCSHGNKQCIIQQCKLSRKRYTAMLTAMPALILSKEEKEVLTKIVQEYQKIHMALYIIDEDAILKAIQKLRTLLTEMNCLPLEPYIENIRIATHHMKEQQQIEGKINSFYQLSHAIDAVMIVVYPQK